MDVAETLKQLAKGLEDNPQFKTMQGWLGERDPGDVMSPSSMALTRLGAAKELVRGMPNYAKAKEARKWRELARDDGRYPISTKFSAEMSNTIENIRNQVRDALMVLENVPRKVLGDIKEISMSKPLIKNQPYARSEYVFGGQGAATPAVKLKTGQSSQGDISLGKALSHEAGGHGVVDRLLEKKGFPSPLKTAFDIKARPESEAIAEYWSVMKDKQKPFIGHGEKQLQKLSEIPTRSKNVEYNVMRYLDEILDKYGFPRRIR